MTPKPPTPREPEWLPVWVAVIPDPGIPAVTTWGHERPIILLAAGATIPEVWPYIQHSPLTRRHLLYWAAHLGSNPDNPLDGTYPLHVEAHPDLVPPALRCPPHIVGSLAAA